MTVVASTLAHVAKRSGERGITSQITNCTNRSGRSHNINSATASLITGKPIAICKNNELSSFLRERYFLITDSSNSVKSSSKSVSSSRDKMRFDSSMVAANHRINYNLHNDVGLNNNYNNSTHVDKLHIKRQQQRYFTAQPSETISAAAATTNKKKATTMDDEYGEMTSEGSIYKHVCSKTGRSQFTLESGCVLEDAELRYQTYGKLNQTKDNVLVVCHALTGNASLHAWWGGLLGPNLPFDTSKYFVISANILGSCYGSTSPRSIHPQTGSVYGNDFPDISVQDTVRLQLKMLKSIGVRGVKCVVGGSFGGMQCVEYAAQAGTSTNPWNLDGSSSPFVRSVIPIGCGAAHTGWQIALSEVQRQAIYADPLWNHGNIDPNNPPLNGLSVARQIAMVSYRTQKGYEDKFGRRTRKSSSETPTTPSLAYGSETKWEIKSYLKYQGQKFLSRFDPVTYVKLTEQMDSHDVGRNRGGKKVALSSVEIPALVLGIDSDVLYPLNEQKELVELLPQGTLGVIRSDAGHDGFLLEQDQVGRFIKDFLEKNY